MNCCSLFLRIVVACFYVFLWDSVLIVELAFCFDFYGLDFMGGLFLGCYSLFLCIVVACFYVVL